MRKLAACLLFFALLSISTPGVARSGGSTHSQKIANKQARKAVKQQNKMMRHQQKLQRKAMKEQIKQQKKANKQAQKQANKINKQLKKHPKPGFGGAL